MILPNILSIILKNNLHIRPINPPKAKSPSSQRLGFCFTKKKTMIKFIKASIREKKSSQSGASVPLSIDCLLSSTAILTLRIHSTANDYEAVLRDSDLETIRKKYLHQNSQIDLILVDAKEAKKLLE